MFDILVTVPVIVLVLGAFFGLIRVRRAFAVAFTWALVWFGLGIYELVDALVLTNTNLDDTNVFTYKLILSGIYFLVAFLSPLIGVMTSWLTSTSLPLEMTPAHKVSKATVQLSCEVRRRYCDLRPGQQQALRVIARHTAASALYRFGDYLGRHGRIASGALAQDMSRLCEGEDSKK